MPVHAQLPDEHPIPLNKRKFRWWPLIPAVFLCQVISAQSPAGLHRWDERIQFFFETDQRDSFLYYASAKIRLARSLDSLAVWVRIQYAVAEFHLYDPPQALSYADKAIQEKWRDPVSKAEWEEFLYFYTLRGNLLFKSGRLWEAIQSFEEAHSILSSFQFPDYNAVEYLFKPLGNHYTRLGDNEKALVIFQKALGLSLERADNESLAGLYNNIGIAYWNKGDSLVAGQNFTKGLSLKGISSVKRALLEGGLARVQISRGEYLKSYKTAQKALSLLAVSGSGRPPSPEHRERIRLTAGEACMHLGRFSEAEQLFAGALKDAQAVFGDAPHRDYAKIQIAFSTLYRRQGQLNRALQTSNEALKRLMPEFVPQGFPDNPDAQWFYPENAIAEALREKAECAEAMYLQSGETRWLELELDCYELARQAEMRRWEAFMYQSSRLNMQQEARLTEEAAMQAARMLYERTGKTIYLEKGFAIAEQSKALLLLDAVQNNLIRQRLAGKDSRFEKISTLQFRVAYLENRLHLERGDEQAARWQIEADELLQEIAGLKKEIFRHYPGLATPMSDILKKAQNFRSLLPEEMLLEYFVSKTYIDVFVADNQGLKAWQRYNFTAGLKRDVGDFLQYFRPDSAQAIEKQPDDYAQKAYSLWEQLIPSEIRSARKLLIVPAGFLCYFPFDALLTAPPAKPIAMRAAPFFLRRHQARYAWSLTALSRQDSLRFQSGKHLLGVAPGFDKGERGLAPVQACLSVWNTGNDTRLLNGAQAHKDEFGALAGQFKLLHLHTHAIAGEQPRIELWDDALFLPDVYALSLQADLVILSACESGTGLLYEGEGVMSLAKAFAHGGAAGVISSLWTANNAITCSLFGEFYSQLEKNRSAADALYQAKIHHLERTEQSAALSPYYWAGFIMIGSDREINLQQSVWQRMPLLFWIGLLLLPVLFFILQRVKTIFRRFAGK